MRAFALAFSVIAFSAPLTAQQPFPGTLPGTRIDGGLAAGFEASGAVWHPRFGRLFVVDDGGTLTSMDANGGNVQSWSLGGLDLEAVCVADPASDVVFIGVEHPDSILEFDVVAGAVTRQFDLTATMTGPNNQGLEALTFARIAAHTEGGLFYAGLQDDGRVYEFELPIVSSAVSTSVSHLSTLTPAPLFDDISGMDWIAETDTLMACFDSFDQLLAFDRTGVVSDAWVLPGDDQEGVALLGCRLFVAQDTGEVWRYEDFPNVQGSWLDLGGGTAGAAGVPVLSGTGHLTAATPVDILLTNTPANAPLLAWLSFAPVPFPALGGTVHAFPFSTQIFFQADAAGTFNGATTWPPGLPNGTSLWMQFLVADPTSIHGITLSNGLRATTP